MSRKGPTTKLSEDDVRGLRHRFRLQVKAPRLPPAPLDIHASPLFHPICEHALLFQPTLLAVAAKPNIVRCKPKQQLQLTRSSAA